MALGDFIVINSVAHGEFTYKHEYAHTIHRVHVELLNEKDHGRNSLKEEQA
jgi:hypothetical protein